MHQLTLTDNHHIKKTAPRCCQNGEEEKKVLCNFSPKGLKKGEEDLKSGKILFIPSGFRKERKGTHGDYFKVTGYGTGWGEY